MQDTMTRTEQSTVAELRTPRLATKVLCTLATAMCAWVAWVLITGNSPALTRMETFYVFCAAVVGLPALYMLARDLMGCPPAKNAVSAFRVGMAVGKLRRR